MKKLVVSISLGAALFAGSSRACDVCATHIALAGQEAVGRPNLGIFEQYSKFDPSGDSDEKFTSWTTQFALNYRLNDRFALQAGIPHLERELNGDNERGIGDATALAIVRALNYASEHDVGLVDVYAGLELPTGDSDLLKGERDAAMEEREHAEHGHEEGEHGDHPTGHHLALGSGSWDGILGASAYGKRDRWSAQGNAQYKLNTEGDYDFEYGDEIAWLVGGRYFALLEDRQSLAIGVDISGNWQDQNKVLGETDTDHPKTRAAYAGPAVNYTYEDRLNVAFAWDFAIAGEDNGLQGAADTHVRASASWLF